MVIFATIAPVTAVRNVHIWFVVSHIVLCMVDMSVAFDVVDIPLLLEKLKLYGFDRSSLQWTWSYLTYRSQGVYIEGSMSKLLPLEAGVPQGSILGPLFYTIFTNELPEVVHDANCPNKSEPEASLFSIYCHKCGGMCCYADDSTFTIADKEPANLPIKLSEKYKTVSDYLTASKLKVNDDKTHLLLMTTRQKRKFIDTSNVTITTPNAVVKPSPLERLLGAQVHENMRWREHILTSDNCLIKSLNTRQSAVKKMSKSASFKARKMLANGLFMSKLIYLMPVWLGCEDYLVKALQVAQNKMARTVTGKDIFTPTRQLLLECGWLSVRQLLIYHSLVQVHKTMKQQAPTYLYRRVSTQLSLLQAGSSYPYRTRSEAHGVIRRVPEAEARLDLAERSWFWPAPKMYNTLPTTIKTETKLQKFKMKLKAWVLSNIAL